ncbi:MAG: uroporphyrinogen-III C-methyltransferase [Candidatus Omnitrophota bacterium]|nr:uroporphyrinogen-III C-methyltransferase [Candidatus Omnitrophota bacterium]
MKGKTINPHSAFRIPHSTRGIVSLVGAGPGDPKLLTVRGQELLRQADVVVYDHLVSPRLLRACPPTAKALYVGKIPGGRSVKQQAINALLIREARSGKRVVRLKGGDPFLFGRGGEEALALAQAQIPFEVVPGVTSAIAVPAYAGIPVTHRGLSSSVAIVTGHEDPAKAGSAMRWGPLAAASDTLVCLMGVGELAAIAERLRRHGRRATTPCAVIEWGTTSRQRVISGTLRTIAARAVEAAIQPPAVLVVGQVVRLRESLRWFERRPLFGKRILVTRASDNAATLTDQLEARGAEVEELPMIELVSVRANGLFRHAVNEMPKTHWVFFTSPEGIDWFARRLRPYRKDMRWLAGCRIGAIGPKTAAAIEKRGLRVDVVPRRYSQEGLLEQLPRRALKGKRALILSAAGSRDVLTTGLRQRGMQVTKVPLYQAVVPRGTAGRIRAIFQRPIDLVTVTSASCVDHLASALRAAREGARFRQLRFASIGPVTSAAVRAAGGTVAVEAATSTIEGLVEAMTRHDV